ncbi:DNA photolyase family protein [Rhizobium sp. XQZ8]|uniref:cryptochrome/photolyase family protein n=1 Tax=Rhizobium populisoli TaxID=2859785 RepID=UPI001C66F28B|nr:deoxyribodipyrimidine photo-lyase [Rhizobium populisoli]MBW6424770.1 DNA photolyase family protein [Rhizobium populisoli]
MSEQKPAPSILWFRKDLRLDDNPALHAAIEAGGPVIPVYIREPEHLNVGPLGAAQAWWLHHSLTGLKTSLKSLGSDLVFASGKAEDVLADIAQKTGAKTVFVNRAYERTSFDRDIAIALKEDGIAIRAYHGQLLHEPKSIRTGSGNAFKVFTPFWNAMQKIGEPHDPVDAPDTIPSPEHFPKSESLDGWDLLPKKPDWAADFPKMWTPGEDGAQEKLSDFLDRELHDYKRGRDLPAVDATSLLSPHLAHGEISPSRIWHATRGQPKKAADEVSHFRRELAWRDFCYNLLIEFPELNEKNWDDKFDPFEWEYDAKDFHAWTSGRTGYPIVDAGMRQLWRYGFMHNRVRMIAASFLIKDLMIDWRKGEKWFRDTLVDADPANNSANWQWVAGSGADASPFFRIFNPILQGEKFDPDGDYVREHVPELAKLDRKYIHKPFDAPKDVLEKAGIELGKTYPKPVVDHGFARDRALAAYRKIR